MKARIIIGLVTIKTAPRLMSKAKADPMIAVLKDSPDLMASLEKLAERMG